MDIAVLYLLLHLQCGALPTHGHQRVICFHHFWNLFSNFLSANSKNEENCSLNQIPVSNNHTCKTSRLSVKHIVETIFKTPDFLWLVCYVLTYKLGEQGVVSLLPLHVIDQGIPQDEVGVIFGIFGQLFSIMGSTLGGWIVGLHHGQRWLLYILYFPFSFSDGLKSSVLSVTQVFDHDVCFNIQTEPNKNYTNQFPENKWK